MTKKIKKDDLNGGAWLETINKMITELIDKKGLDKPQALAILGVDQQKYQKAQKKKIEAVGNKGRSDCFLDCEDGQAVNGLDLFI